MKLKEVLEKTTQYFKDKNLDSPRLDAELLLAFGLKLERIQLYLKFDQPLSEEEMNNCRDLVRRRAMGEPIAYILGRKDFFGYTFKVNPAVLIPRPETEHLVEASLEWATSQNPEKPFSILDLGTGSGCIGLTLLKKLPNSLLLAVDISESAIQVAKENAEALNVAERVRFVCADVGCLDIEIPKIDILVANPPYIAEGDLDLEENVKKFEPKRALFASENGLEFLRSWSKKFVPFLNDKAIVLMEMGMNQGEEMKEYFRDLGVFSKVDVIKDLASLDRVIRGVKNG